MPDELNVLRQGSATAHVAGEQPTFAQLADRVAQLEDQMKTREFGLEQIPVNDLMRKLESVWQPEAFTLLAPGTITDLNIGDAAKDLFEMGAVGSSAAGATFSNAVWGSAPIDTLDLSWGSKPPEVGPTLLTVRRAGIYLFWGIATWATNTVGSRWLGYYKNGVTPFASIANQLATGAGGGTIQQGVYFDALDVGDTVRTSGWQSSGGVLAMSAGLCRAGLLFLADLP